MANKYTYKESTYNKEIEVSFEDGELYMEFDYVREDSCFGFIDLNEAVTKELYKAMKEYYE